MGLAWEKAFVMLLVFVVFLNGGTSTLVSQLRESLHQLWALPWLLSVVLLLPGFSVTVLPRVLRLWGAIFYPQGCFTLHSFPTFLTYFLTQMRAGTPHPGSSSVPALTELSFTTDSCSWTAHIEVTRRLIYQLRQGASKYRVKIKLLNMFHLFINYKDTLNKTW